MSWMSGSIGPIGSKSLPLHCSLYSWLWSGSQGLEFKAWHPRLVSLHKYAQQVSVVNFNMNNFSTNHWTIPYCAEKSSPVISTDVQVLWHWTWSNRFRPPFFALGAVFFFKGMKPTWAMSSLKGVDGATKAGATKAGATKAGAISEPRVKQC